MQEGSPYWDDAQIKRAVDIVGPKIVIFAYGTLSDFNRSSRYPDAVLKKHNHADLYNLEGEYEVGQTGILCLDEFDQGLKKSTGGLIVEERPLLLDTGLKEYKLHVRGKEPVIVAWSLESGDAPRLVRPASFVPKISEVRKLGKLEMLARRLHLL